MTPRKPVTDWTCDWDHLDPRWREDPYPIWDELRRSCPIAHTERYQGAYLPTRYEDVRAIANDSTHFSSRRVIVREVRPEPIPSPPITSDPPHHKPYKQLLLPPFTAEAMTRLEPKARAICNELIDKFIADGNCDAAQQYTRHIPAKVIGYRHTEEQREALLEIRWWDWPEEDVIEAVPYLASTDIDAFIEWARARRPSPSPIASPTG